jgi:type I restriction enzyme S subunit
MELRKGFKKTEVGNIPNDWEVKKLESLSSKIMVGIASAATHAYCDIGVVLFRNQNIKNNYLDDSDILHVTKEYEELFKGKRLRTGDLLTARTGYPGTTCLVSKKYDGSQSFTTLITRPQSNLIMSDFLCFYINSEIGQLFFETNKIGGGQKNVNAGTLKKMPIIVPAQSEQTAIAKALSDTNAWIKSLEQLLTKKRQIKQGALQELLKPKVGWVVKKLGECLKVKHGRSQKEVEDKNGKYPILGTGGLMSYTDSYLCDKPSVLIGRKGTIDKPQFMDSPFWTVDTLFYTEISQNISAKFIYYRFLLIDWYLYNEASGVPSLNAKTIENIEISIPHYKEQTRIATILSDMDTDIFELETKHGKAKQIKQGMMQDLLTGRIRLV